MSLVYGLFWRCSHIKAAYRDSFNTSTVVICNLLSSVIALIIASALSSYFLPSLLATLMTSLGLPFAVAFIGAAAAYVTLIAVTYHLLILLPFTLPMHFYYEKYEKKDKLRFCFKIWGASLAIAAAYFFFVPLTQALVPLTGIFPFMATFLALAVSVSVMVGMMKLLPVVLFDPLVFMASCLPCVSSGDRVSSGELKGDVALSNSSRMMRSHPEGRRSIVLPSSDKGQTKPGPFSLVSSAFYRWTWPKSGKTG